MMHRKPTPVAESLANDPASGATPPAGNAQREEINPSGLYDCWGCFSVKLQSVLKVKDV